MGSLLLHLLDKTAKKRGINIEAAKKREMAQNQNDQA